MVPTTIVIGAAAVAPTLFGLVAWLFYRLGARAERRKTLDLRAQLDQQLKLAHATMERITATMGRAERLVRASEGLERAVREPHQDTRYPRADEEPWSPATASRGMRIPWLSI